MSASNSLSPKQPGASVQRLRSAPIHHAQTAHQFALTVVRRAILTGELAAGSRLFQEDIADRLGLSTTPVREALRELAHAGLVNFDPHRGAVVANVTGGEVVSIVEVRFALEPLAVEMAIGSMSRDPIRRLDSLYLGMLGDPESPGWVDKSRRFQRTILNEANRPRLAAILMRLQDASLHYLEISRKQRPDVRTAVNDQLGALLRAIRKHDPAGAAPAVQNQLSFLLELTHLEQPESRTAQ